MLKLRLWDRMGQRILFLLVKLQTVTDPEAARAEKIEEYREKFANPYVAASMEW